MNQKICIIVGHGKSKSGGYDPGACTARFQEFRLAREIARFASERLCSEGFDCTLMNYDGELYLTERIKAVNASDYDFIAEIHLNAGGGTGTEVYYSLNSALGKKAAGAVSLEISKALGVRNRGAKTKLNAAGADYFGIIRQTKPCAILVETAFIDTDDVLLLSTEQGQRKCGGALADALASTLSKEAEKAFRVKIKCRALNVRSGPGTQYPVNTVVYANGVFTVVRVEGTWGKLKSGAGWISIKPEFVGKVD